MSFIYNIYMIYNIDDIHNIYQIWNINNSYKIKCQSQDISKMWC